MTSDASLDDRYLDWLYKLIALPRAERNPARSFTILADQLFRKPFVWFVPNDDNRIVDGLDLREEFINDTAAEHNRRWLEQECSMLEMLIALSRRVEFETTKDSFYWFWKMLENLNIRIYSDDLYDEEVQMIVNDTIVAVIDRRYRPDGLGGLFPLKDPPSDQREVEIWYQMASYLIENGYD